MAHILHVGVYKNVSINSIASQGIPGYICQLLIVTTVTVISPYPSFLSITIDTNWILTQPCLLSSSDDSDDKVLDHLDCDILSPPMQYTSIQ